MNELTVEQHLKNLEVAVVKAVGSYDELTAIRASYLYIKELALNTPKNLEQKEIALKSGSQAG